jgi:hypothetical protein
MELGFGLLFFTEGGFCESRNFFKTTELYSCFWLSFLRMDLYCKLL